MDSTGEEKGAAADAAEAWRTGIERRLQAIKSVREQAEALALRAAAR